MRRFSHLVAVALVALLCAQSAYAFGKGADAPKPVDGKCPEGYDVDCKEKCKTKKPVVCEDVPDSYPTCEDVKEDITVKDCYQKCSIGGKPSMGDVAKTVPTGTPMVPAKDGKVLVSVNVTKDAAKGMRRLFMLGKGIKLQCEKDEVCKDKPAVKITQNCFDKKTTKQVCSYKPVSTCTTSCKCNKVISIGFKKDAKDDKAPAAAPAAAAANPSAAPAAAPAAPAVAAVTKSKP